jgi:Fur family transcriptional regulator, zinc uptake regulator
MRSASEPQRAGTITKVEDCQLRPRHPRQPDRDEIHEVDRYTRIMAHRDSHHHHHKRVTSPARILAAAAHLCARHGEKMTPLREKALLAIAATSGPVKAYDLLPALGTPSQPAKPATAYRALEFFEQIGLVHRIEAMNAYVYCEHGGGDHGTAMYICRSCETIEEVPLRSEPMPADAPEGFLTERIVIESYGLCAACAIKADQ